VSAATTAATHPPGLAGLPCERRFPELAAWSPPGASAAEQEDNLRLAAAELLEPAGEEADPAFDNPEIPAGYTYFGQFLDHDLLFLAQPEPGGPVHNLRRPALDLDSLYGDGPDASPHLYDPGKPGRLLYVRRTAPRREADLWRRGDGVALLGDPRNDENVLVSQMHLAFLRFHDRAIEQLGLPFAEARRWTTWHYQWIVLHDFLPRLVGREAVERRLAEARAGSREPWELPLEFSAAYRFGHSLVRSSYRLNETLAAERGALSVFEAAATDAHGRFHDLRGGRRLPLGWGVDWRLFLPSRPAAGAAPQASRRIDGRLNRKLSLVAGPGGPTSLPFRNLKRGWDHRLSSGQALAAALGLEPLSDEALGLGPWFGGEAPLWAYVLKEAELGGGLRLGPLGAAVVTETLVGLVAGDPESCWNREPDWRPAIGAVPGELTLSDMVAWALGEEAEGA
jgi:hypothetical protein